MSVTTTETRPPMRQRVETTAVLTGRDQLAAHYAIGTLMLQNIDRYPETIIVGTMGREVAALGIGMYTKAIEKRLVEEPDAETSANLAAARNETAEYLRGARDTALRKLSDANATIAALKDKYESQPPTKEET